MIKRIMSSVLSVALLIGSFSNFAFAENGEEAKREQIKIYKTTEDQAFNNPKLVTAWDYDEGKNTYTENGKELSFISNDEIKFSGKTPKSGAIEAIVKKSIPVKSIVEYYENKKSEKFDKDKLSLGFVAPDGFKFETEYGNLVNLEGKSDIIYIEGFSPDNYSEGVPVDAVISLDSIRGDENETESLPRLYKGINRGTEYKSIANFGYESISNIAKVILKDYYTVSMVSDDNKDIENVIKTDDGIYFSDDTIENEERNSFKLLNKSRNISPGEKVEIKVYNGANAVVTKKKRAKKDEGAEIETVKDENDIISFTMPTSDVSIKLTKDESEKISPFAYIRMEYPELEGDTLSVKLNLREYNLTD
ncbi:MAG: hypothetical protein Q4P31_07260, partial [Andreesenia angusta]|nr:hypothetical protein [Andreesenia angusta]